MRRKPLYRIMFILIIMIPVFINAQNVNSSVNTPVKPGISSINVTPSGKAVDIKDYGAKGDGLTDDTEAIIAAVKNAADGLVEFPGGSYRITRSIEIFLSENGPMGLSGKGGGARIMMDGEGPAFRIIGTHEGASYPHTIKPEIWEKERMPLIENLEITGTHPKADGIELHKTMQPVLQSLQIRNVRKGIHLTSRGRNVIINSCHVFGCSEVGIFLDNINLHQIIISNSHISFCRLGGIKVLNGEVRNLQITGNDIEYNCETNGPLTADIWIDCSQDGSVREGTISGNTIQAIPSPAGANILFTGPDGNPGKIGLLSITGNHISSQSVNIHLNQVRGVTIQGNTFIRGYECNLIIDNSHNVVINDNVFDHNEEYFAGPRPASSGIMINKGQSILLCDNIVDGAEYGAPDTGGAITITSGREITVDGCQIINPKYRGIYIKNCINSSVTKCIVKEDTDHLRMLAGVELKGDCHGTVVRENTVDNGIKRIIINNAKGVNVKENRRLP